MIQSYFNLALRQFKRNKLYKSLNIAGLSIGISCALVIFAYIHFELSFDKQNEHYNKIFRITESITAADGSIVTSATTPGRLGTAIQDHGIPDIEQIGRLFPFPVFISADKRSWTTENLFVFADSTISEIFTFDVIEGSLESTLRKPMSVALTEHAATKYFGSQNPIGRELYYEDESGNHTFFVEAIIRNPPSNIHFDFDFLASFKSMETVMPWYDSWHHPYLYTYGKVTDISEEGFKNTSELLAETIHKSLPEWEKDARSYEIQPLRDIHLHSQLTGEWKSNSRYEYIVIFVLIAVFILLIACVNFINLSTSRAIRRAKEVGVRKVMGASKRMLITQFLGESFLTTLFSFIVAFALTEWVMLLQFNKIVERELSLSFLYQPQYIILIIAGLAFVGLLAGVYPAFVLSSFKPNEVLRSRTSGGLQSARLRKVLVTFQFTISCFLIAGTLIVAKQVKYMKNKNLGFEKDYIMVVKLNNRQDSRNYRQFIDQVNEFSGIVGATVSSHVPGTESLYDNPVVPENSEREDGYNMLVLNVGRDFNQVYNLDVLHGRFFSMNNAADIDQSVLINESAAKLFGWDPAESTGRSIQLTWYTDSAIVKQTKVIGVIKDFQDRKSVV